MDSARLAEILASNPAALNDPQILAQLMGSDSTLKCSEPQKSLRPTVRVDRETPEYIRRLNPAYVGSVDAGGPSEGPELFGDFAIWERQSLRSRAKATRASKFISDHEVESEAALVTARRKETAHTEPYGSYWSRGEWGYACCHGVGKDVPCTARR